MVAIQHEPTAIMGLSSCRQWSAANSPVKPRPTFLAQTSPRVAPFAASPPLTARNLCPPIFASPRLHAISASKLRFVDNVSISSVVNMMPTTNSLSNSQCARELVMPEVVEAQTQQQVETRPEPPNDQQPELMPVTPMVAQIVNSMLVGDLVLEVSHVLGRGAFGVVWEVREKLVGNVAAEAPVLALKCSHPASQDAFGAAVLECEVLQRLTTALQGKYSQVPRYIGHSTNADSSEVNLVMSKVGGRPLDLWLYGITERPLMDISMTRLLEGPLPGGRHASRCLARTVEVVGALLTQMAPIFSTLEGIAYHRDISAHNFMVQGTGVSHIDFVMIDFGLAVDARSWKGEWRSTNICGDPRYWSPATWINFAHGSAYLELHPNAGLRKQYEERLDHYSFGVLLLEVLFALWEGPDQDPSGGQTMADARAAWHVYWTKSYGLFQRFHSNGGQGYLQLRKDMASSGDLPELLAANDMLCIALRAAARNILENGQSCELGVEAARPVLLAAAELIDPKGTLQWSSVPDLMASVSPPLFPAATPRQTPTHRRVWSEASTREGSAPTALSRSFSHRKQRSDPAFVIPRMSAPSGHNIPGQQVSVVLPSPRVARSCQLQSQ